jgi:hypothetical protein
MDPGIAAIIAAVISAVAPIVVALITTSASRTKIDAPRSFLRQWSFWRQFFKLSFMLFLTLFVLISALALAYAYFLMLSDSSPLPLQGHVAFILLILFNAGLFAMFGAETLAEWPRG